jgi:flavin-dependent dehydrogenase
VFSLICGRAAGQVAHEASVADDASASFLSKYEKRWKRVIGRDFEVMRRIRRMLFRLPDHQLNKIFAAASRLDLSSVLSKADDIDMQGRTLARLGADPRLAIFLLYSSVISVPSSLNREGHRLSSNKHVPRE